MILKYKEFSIDIPFNAISIEDIKINISLNNHGKLYLKLLISEDKIDSYVNNYLTDKKVTVSYKENTVIFVGEIDNVRMICEGKVAYIEINCISMTRKYDIKKNNRVYCNLDMTYKELIADILKSYKKRDFIDNITKGMRIGNFILQYEETDWQFIKRMATHFNQLLVPDVSSQEGKFYFGLPNNSKSYEINLEEYNTKKNIMKYKEKEAHF